MGTVPESKRISRSELRETLEGEWEQAHRAGEPDALDLSGVYLFLSFDLVDATRYKEVDPSGWPFLIGRFYELVTSSADKYLQPIHLWKLAGDEVLLYKPVTSSNDLASGVRAAYSILHDTVVRLHQHEGASPILSVKGVAWCAKVNHIHPQKLVEARAEFEEGHYRNIVVPQLLTPSEGLSQLDFLGPDIDTGFRLGKHVSRKRLVVSAELAYLLHRDRANNEPIEEQLRIVAYEPLKGIWGGRRYPIVWYEENWSSVSETFEYDERFESAIVGRIVDDRGSLEPLSQIPRVYGDLNRLAEVSGLYDFVSHLKPGGSHAPTPSQTTTLQPKVEVHLVAVCFRRSDGRALVAQRPENKRRFGGKWEFGCGQLRAGESFHQAIRRAYAEDFGADLEFPGGLTFVASYEIPERPNRGVIPGLIFLAEVTNPDSIKARRHPKINWVDPERPTELPESGDCVPDLIATLRTARQLWEQMKTNSADSPSG